MQALAPGSQPHSKPWQPRPPGAGERVQDVGTAVLGCTQTTRLRQRGMKHLPFLEKSQGEHGAGTRRKQQRQGPGPTPSLGGLGRLGPWSGHLLDNGKDACAASMTWATTPLQHGPWCSCYERNDRQLDYASRTSAMVPSHQGDANASTMSAMMPVQCLQGC